MGQFRSIIRVVASETNLGARLSTLRLAIVCIFLFLWPTLYTWGSPQQVVPSSTPGTGVFNEGYVPPVTVDPAKGIAHTTFPFSLPAARGAAQPSLQLVYSSAAGTETAGAGWGLELPVIERRPLSNPGSGLGNRYAISGAAIIPICVVQQGRCAGQRLEENMPPWANLWTYYRTQVEGQFARIFQSSDGNTWRAEMKNGVTMEFGVPILAPAKGENGIDGAQDQRFRWNLVRQFDTQIQAGTDAPTNIVVYQWSLLGGQLSLNYLTDVYYTLAPGQDSNNRDNFAHHVTLVYEAHDYPTVSNALVWRAVPDLRLKQVDVTSKNFSGIGHRELVRRYILNYNTMLHASYLVSVQLQGRCPAVISEPAPTPLSCPVMPATTFTYTVSSGVPMGPTPIPINFPAPAPPLGVTPTPTVSPSGSYVQPFYDVSNFAVLDVDRDGLPDIMESFGNTVPSTSANAPTPYLNIYLNRLAAGQPTFDYATLSAFSIANYLGGGSTNTFLTSKSGLSIVGYWGNVDRASVLSLNPHGPGPAPFYYISGLTAGAGYAPYWGAWNILSGFSAQWINSIYTVADIDGDGLPDAIDTGNNVWFSKKDLSSGPNYLVPFQINGVDAGNTVMVPTTYNININRYYFNVFSTLFALADINGDGLPDIILFIPPFDNPGGPGAYLYAPGDGTGTFACQRPPDACAAPLGGWGLIEINFKDGDAPPPYTSQIQNDSTKQIFFHDVNGDGLADIILVDLRSGTVSVWLNDDGINFHRIPDISIPAQSSTRVTFADMNGNGTDDIVLITPGNVSFIDFAVVNSPQYSFSVRQGLLVGINDGLGGTTTIAYDTTADLDAIARGTANPWSHHSSRVEYVVTSVSSTTNLPAPYNHVRSIQYAYQDAIYDDWQQAFLGFGTVWVTHQGYDGALDVTTETTYFFGHCQNADTNYCVETSDDDEWKAVTGVPAVSEIYDSAGAHYSTSVWDYQSQTLFTGTDGRHVRFAYPKRTDTWLYDAGAFTPSPQTISAPVVERLVPGAAPAVDSLSVTLASRQGRVHLRSEQTMDAWGNATQTVEYGRIQDDGTRIDQPIIANITPVTPAKHWRWLTGNIIVEPFSDGTPRNITFKYDNEGNLKTVEGQLTGSLPLDRFHEDPQKKTAPAPPTASVDNPNLQLASLTYDSYGSVTQIVTPDNGCQQFTYDQPYQHLLVSATVHKAGCARIKPGPHPVPPRLDLPLTTSYIYDRGLGRVVSSTAPSGAQSALTYDGFGRTTAIYEPDPDTGSTSANPSVTFEYLIHQGGPTQFVHIRVANSQGAQNVSPGGKQTPRPLVWLYVDRWIYLDGFGTPILALSQAAGTNHWVGSGLAVSRMPGFVYETFQPWFYDGAAESYPVAQPTATVRRIFERDGLGRETQVSDATQRISLYVHHALSWDDWNAENLNTSGSHANLPSTVQSDGHGRIVAATRQIRVPVTVTNLGAPKGIQSWRTYQLDKITTAWSYLSTGEVAEQILTHSRGNEQVVRTMGYDSLGRLVSNFEPNTSHSVKTFRCPSPSHSHTDCESVITTLGWLYAYDDAGHLVGTSDARGCGENLYYDGLGRLDAEDYSPCRSYQSNYTGPPNLQDGSNTESFFWYDAPEPGQTQDFGTSASFLAGKLVASSDLGANTRLAWDARGRLIGRARQIAKPVAPGSSPTPVVAARYAPWWFRMAQTYDVADRLADQSTGADVPELMGAGPTGANSDLQYSYDSQGQLTSLVGSYGTLVAEATYDADGALLQMVYGDPSGTFAEPAYDARRRLREFKVVRPGHRLARSPTTSQFVFLDLAFGYDLVDDPVAITDQRPATEWPSGAKPVTRSEGYDDLYRLESVAYANGDDIQVSPFAAEAVSGDTAPVPMQQLGNRIQLQGFNYDFLGNLTSSSDDVQAFYDRSLGNVTNGIEQQGPPNQFVSAAMGSGGTATAHYDAAGNLEDLVIVRGGGVCASLQGCSQRFSYEWDEVGRLSRGWRWDYVAIPANEPVYPALPTREADEDLQYKYDAGGARVLKSKTASGGDQLHTATIFPSLRLNHAMWDSSSGDYERSPLTETVYLGRIARVVYSQQPLSSPTNANQYVFFLIGDPSGSMSVVIDQATSELVERATYDAFGAPDTDYRMAQWANFREDYRFTGKEDDIEVGLTYFGARYYQAALGRWISPDPLTIHGLAADVNPYAYVNASPLRFVDPLGLDGDDGFPSGCDDLGNYCSGGGSGGGVSSGGEGAGSGGGGGSTIGGSGNGPNRWYLPGPPPPPPAPPAPSGVLSLQGSGNVNGGYSIPLSFWENDANWAALQRGFGYMAIGALSIATGASALEAFPAAANTVRAIFASGSVEALKANLIPVAQFATNFIAAINGNAIIGAGGGGSAAEPELAAAGNAASIRTPYAIETQSASAAAQAALAQVQNGANIYRTGELGISMAGESQYWSLQSPLAPGYASSMGMPNVTPDFILSGSMKLNASVIANEAAALGTNTGQGIQIVISPAGIRINWFHMP